MVYTVHTLEQEPALRPTFGRFHAFAWPDFLQDDAVQAIFSEIYTKFPAFQLALRDHTGRVVAVGNSVPFAWDGTRAGLPDRLVDVIVDGLRALERGRRPSAVSALAAIVEPRFRGRHLSRRVIVAMRRRRAVRPLAASALAARRADPPDRAAGHDGRGPGGEVGAADRSPVPGEWALRGAGRVQSGRR